MKECVEIGLIQWMKERVKNWNGKEGMEWKDGMDGMEDGRKEGRNGMEWIRMENKMEGM